MTPNRHLGLARRRGRNCGGRVVPTKGRTPNDDERSEGAMSETTETTKVILNLGMGVESSAILARLLLEPDVRDFDLADLVVVTSQTGDEFPDTGALVETHLLPLMKAHGVRNVQVARAGAVKVGGRNVRVLSDG